MPFYDLGIFHVWVKRLLTWIALAKVLQFVNPSEGLDSFGLTLKSCFLATSGIVECSEGKVENEIPGAHNCHPTGKQANEPKCLFAQYRNRSEGLSDYGHIFYC